VRRTELSSDRCTNGAIAVHIAWIYHQLVASLGSVPDNLSLCIRIFITRPTSTARNLPLASLYQRFDVALGPYDKNWTVKEKTALTSFRNVHIEQGRPRIDSIIADEARSSLGSMSVDGKQLSLCSSTIN